MAATLAGSTCRNSSRSASHAERHQSSGFCSYRLCAGFRRGIGLRPSPATVPSGLQAIALVAVVLLSSPITMCLSMLTCGPQHHINRDSGPVAGPPRRDSLSPDLQRIQEIHHPAHAFAPVLALVLQSIRLPRQRLNSQRLLAYLRFGMNGALLGRRAVLPLLSDQLDDARNPLLERGKFVRAHGQ